MNPPDLSKLTWECDRCRDGQWGLLYGLDGVGNLNSWGEFCAYRCRDCGRRIEK